MCKTVWVKKWAIVKFGLQAVVDTLILKKIENKSSPTRFRNEYRWKYRGNDKNDKYNDKMIKMFNHIFVLRKKIEKL